jgi:hypothetical protein
MMMIMKEGEFDRVGLVVNVTNATNQGRKVKGNPLEALAMKRGEDGR